jgi:hypothetical protein
MLSKDRLGREAFQKKEIVIFMRNYMLGILFSVLTCYRYAIR